MAVLAVQKTEEQVAVAAQVPKFGSQDVAELPKTRPHCVILLRTCLNVHAFQENGGICRIYNIFMENMNMAFESRIWYLNWKEAMSSNVKHRSQKDLEDRRIRVFSWHIPILFYSFLTSWMEVLKLCRLQVCSWTSRCGSFLPTSH